jgi:hypothetical protein
MKNLFFILSIITLFSCSKKDDTTNPNINTNKTIKELVTQNEWVFKQGSLLRLSGVDRYDTVVKFNLDSTIKVSVYRNDTFTNDISFRHTHYSISNDSIYGTLVFRDIFYWDDSLFYSMKRESNNDLVGTKIESFHITTVGYIRKPPVNVRIGIR